MKKFILLITVFLGITGLRGQTMDSIATNADSTAVKQEQENREATKDSTDQNVMGDKPEITEKGDTTRIHLGKKSITIVKKDGITNVQIDEKGKGNNEAESEENENNSDSSDVNENNDMPKFNPFHKKSEGKKFNPHWAGFQLTLNNFMTKEYSLSLPKESQFLELNAGTSIGVDINLMEYAIPFTTTMGLTTGLGFEFNSYYFDSDTNNITKQNGYIVPKVKPKDAGDYSKNKLKDTYLTIPLLYEIQFPLGNTKHPLYFSFGVIGGLKLGSTTKEYYQLNGDDKKDIVHGDFYISPIRYGYQARVGFRRIHLVATYYASPMFQNGKGPEVHPFDIGLMLINW